MNCVHLVSHWVWKIDARAFTLARGELGSTAVCVARAVGRGCGGEWREVGGMGERLRGGEAWPVEDCFEDCFSIAGARRLSLEGRVCGYLLILGL